MTEIILLIGDEQEPYNEEDEVALYVDRKLVEYTVGHEDFWPMVDYGRGTVFQILQLMRVKSPSSVGISSMEDLERFPDHVLNVRLFDKNKQPIPVPDVLTDDLFKKYKATQNRRKSQRERRYRERERRYHEGRS